MEGGGRRGPPTPWVGPSPPRIIPLAVPGGGRGKDQRVALRRASASIIVLPCLVTARGATPPMVKNTRVGCLLATNRAAAAPGSRDQPLAQSAQDGRPRVVDPRGRAGSKPSRRGRPDQGSATQALHKQPKEQTHQTTGCGSNHGHFRTVSHAKRSKEKCETGKKRIRREPVRHLII